MREIFSVHQRFSTSLAHERNKTIFHFRTNHSLLEMGWMTRVFSKDSFNITLSNTKAQDDQQMTFNFQQNRTVLTGYQRKVWEEKSIFNFGKLNDFEIEISNNSIVFKNHENDSASIVIDGIFEQFKFIGFYSEKFTSWVVPQSKTS